MLNTESLTAIFHSIEDGVSVINRNHEIVMANKGVLSIFGKEYLAENQDKKCFHEFLGREAICENCPAEQIFTRGLSSQFCKISRDTGVRRLVLYHHAFPIKDADGNVTHAVIWFKDVTHVAELEEQLISTERLAGLGMLAAAIAHEIRNPLGSIKATAQFCLSKYELQEGMKKHLKIILRSSDRMNRVVINLLNLAKPREASFTVGNIDKVVCSICGLVKAKCLKQRVRLTKRSTRRLPPILMDEKLLEEAFFNLTLNALEAMPKGGRLALMARYDHNSSEIAISFTDSGCGISENHMNKIFDPFFTTKKDGTGLGLSLARRIIELHKGSIHIHSKPDRGTEISVRLPAHNGGAR